MRITGELILPNSYNVYRTIGYRIAELDLVIQRCRRVANHRSLKTFKIYIYTQRGSTTYPLEIQYKFNGNRRYTIKKNEKNVLTMKYIESGIDRG